MIVPVTHKHNRDLLLAKGAERIEAGENPGGPGFPSGGPLHDHIGTAVLGAGNTSIGARAERTARQERRDWRLLFRLMRRHEPRLH